MEKYDLIIVGAGPAGIFTAVELLRHGSKKTVSYTHLATVLPTTTTTPRTAGVMPTTMIWPSTLLWAARPA